MVGESDFVGAHWNGRRLILAAVVVLAAVSVLVMVTRFADAISSAPPSPTARSALSIAGRGATVPFTEYEAENANTNGAVLTPSRAWPDPTLAAEASGRQAVTLGAMGQYVEFTLTQPANAVDVHYSIPDSPDGSAYTEALAVYVDGQKASDLALTNKYSWMYGDYPYSGPPSAGHGHHFYDDARAMFATTLAIGAKVRLQRDTSRVAETIDTADFEQANPLAEPAGAISVTEFGADPTGSTDSSAAFIAGIGAASAQGKPLWVPVGTFTINRHVTVNNVTIQGAGPWYSVLQGDGIGLYGRGPEAPSAHVKLADFAIFGAVTVRDDSSIDSAVGGALGGGSIVSDIWMEHVKTGIWIDGPDDGLTVTNCRILDTAADGLNLHQGVSHVTVTQNFVRNTGDDAMAMWSQAQADHDNVFSFNTIEMPMLANGIGIYGGRDNSATDNVIADTQMAGGALHVGNQYGSTPLSGTTTLARNTALRTGSIRVDWDSAHGGTPIGALWFDAADDSMTGDIEVEDTDIVDSSYEAIQWIEGSSITNVHFSNVHIDVAGTFALQVQTPGSATFTGVTASGLGYPNSSVYSCLGGSFAADRSGGGDAGWDVANPYCKSGDDNWPNPGPDRATAPGADNPPPAISVPTATVPTATVPTTSVPAATGTAAAGCGPGTGNLAAGKTVTPSSAVSSYYAAAYANDGNTGSYWESANNAFPQTLTADLCTVTPVQALVLGVPPNWPTRSQTIAIAASTDGTHFDTIAGATSYVFDPSGGNTVMINVTRTSLRYLRLTFTANSGWPGAQLGELQVYAP